ncbi:hypothetical protein HGRIS_004380 [Hohenbuehelia grisea]|uniref:Uncharacterized protein n=1 Tax=Hohenbuehelia grisea TaxID=104357 RepID=A0ABR3JCV2_9AGAR
MYFTTFVATAVVLGLASQVNAHAAVLPPISVKGAMTRNQVQRPSSRKPCGNIDVATMDASTPLQAGADGTYVANTQNFNRRLDGSLQFKMQVDPTGTGKNMVAGTIIQNGERAPKSAGTNSTISFKLPAGMQCTGGASGNLCLASFKSASGFGNCVALMQPGAAANANANAAAAANANANANAAAAANTNAAAAANANAAANAKANAAAAAAIPADGDNTALPPAAANAAAAANANAAAAIPANAAAAIPADGDNTAIPLVAANANAAAKANAAAAIPADGDNTAIPSVAANANAAAKANAAAAIPADDGDNTALPAVAATQANSNAQAGVISSKAVGTRAPLAFRRAAAEAEVEPQWTGEDDAVEEFDRRQEPEWTGEDDDVEHVDRRQEPEWTGEVEEVEEFDRRQEPEWTGEDEEVEEFDRREESDADHVDGDEHPEHDDVIVRRADAEAEEEDEHIDDDADEVVRRSLTSWIWA